MKKVAYAILITAGLGMSAAAMAAGTAITSGDSITSENCVLLADQVTLTLSTNVHGAYSCDEFTNTIKIATCHEAGSRKPTEVECALVGGELNPPECTEAGEKVTIADYKAFVGSSDGGRVGPRELGGRCDDGKVSALDFFN